MSFAIRPFIDEDYKQWLPLWDANNSGFENKDISKTTWQRLIDPASPVNGLGYFTEDNTLAGLLHYILHPVTGSIEPVCYMQDVFVAPDHRKKGIAKAMIRTLHVLGQTAKWNRIYWLAERDNIAAQNLYKTIGLQLDFTLHVIPVKLARALETAET